MMDFIPQIEPVIGDKELEQLKRVVNSTFVVEHELTREFEEKIKEYTRAKYAIAMTNGTVALYSILKALGIGKGDEVVIPDLTFIATANSVIMTGAKPVFCDVSYSTCATLNTIKKVITKKTKAIIPVHLYGNACSIDTICAYGRKNDILIVEDAAQSLGVWFRGKHTGTFGNAGFFSFYGNKIITTGEGGVVITDDEKLATECYRLKNHGRDKKGVFIHDKIGFNFSFTEMQAAIGIAQMERLPDILSKKKSIYLYYTQRLNKYFRDKRVRDLDYHSLVTPSYWFSSFLFEGKEKLKKFLLEKKNIQTRDFFLPLHKQPCYNLKQNKYLKYVSNEIFEKGLSLPSSFSITEEKLKYICDSIEEFYD